MAVAPEIHRWSLAAYHQLVETGALEDVRVELIDGLIVDMSPRSPAHDYAVQWLDDALRVGLDARFAVRAGMPLSLGASEPEPDLAIVGASLERGSHPQTAALAIEVSHSSLRRDLHVKPRIYGAAGIPRYWVVDLDGRRAVEHTDPRADGYAAVATCRETLAAPELGIAIALPELLAFALG